MAKSAVRMTVDLREFERSVSTLKATAKKAPNKVMHDEMKLLIKACHRMTPPFPKNPMKGSLAEHRKVGNAAIAGDIFGSGLRSRGKKSVGIFVQEEAEELTGLAAALGEQTEGTAFRTKKGAIYGVENHLFKPKASVSEMAQHHKRFRTKNGRVTTAGSMTRDIGRWKFVDKMHISEKAGERYLKHAQKKVGHAKSGWTDAIRKFKVKGIPKWARAGGPGYAKIKWDKRNASMVYEFANAVEYIQKHGSQLRIIARAIKFRKKAMEIKLKRAMKALERKARQKA